MKTKYDCSNSRKQYCKIVNNMSEKIYSNYQYSLYRYCHNQ